MGLLGGVLLLFGIGLIGMGLIGLGIAAWELQWQTALVGLGYIVGGLASGTIAAAILE